MKRIITGLLTGGALLAISTASHAQCSFVPTVTPNNLVMCPDTQDTLWTQVYDHYQWFKDGTLLPGDTLQYRVVDAFNDGGSNFSVAATLNNCTDTSEEVLVDGWAFLPVTVMSVGNFQIDPNDGHAIICDSNALHNRDTLIFIMNLPYNTNIQWSKDGSIIPGATNDSLRVTATGTYLVQGAPDICPNYVQNSLPLDVEVRNPIPIIINNNGTLMVSPDSTAFTGYQWYRDGSAIAGATHASYVPTVSGAYAVSGNDGFCDGISAPFQFTITDIGNVGKNIRVDIHPNPATDVVQIKAPIAVDAAVYSLEGKLLMQQKDAKQLNISHLSNGMYMLIISDKESYSLSRIKMIKR